ncbi:MAG: tripartite tricarboxylate transporter substrate binding protein [Betaproteobacteria bacterium]|nr:tripartite tricarboxylate transporter substrate binding protein [Betaproteobacteria bacterium]
MKLIFLVAAAVFLASPALAQKWPEKPVKLIVPYPPGGNVDTAARIVSPGLQELLGQPVLVENKPGAGGLIAGEFVAKSAADGYTLFFTANSPLLHAPIMFRRPAYHWEKDFVAVSSVSFTPIVLQVHPSVPAKSLKELLDFARQQPGKLGMSTPSAGTTNHLLSELLQSTAGVSWLTVHYKGNAPATTAMLAGEVQMGFDQVSVALPYIKQGRMRALAVTTEKRVAALPDVPTFAEAGMNNMEAATFTAVVAPAGTPRDVVARLHDAIARVLVQKSVMERFEGIGAEARATAPDALTTYFRNEYNKWTPVIQKADIKAN